jgi:hypothetical protein
MQLKCPDIRIELDEPLDLANVHWESEFNFEGMLDGSQPVTWMLYDGVTGEMLYSSTESELSEDGTTLTFKYDFPARDGVTYSVWEQLVVT